MAQAQRGHYVPTFPMAYCDLSRLLADYSLAKHNPVA